MKSNYCYVIFFLVQIGNIFTANSVGLQRLSPESEAAFDFFDKFLQPSSGCERKEYAIADMGHGGGFASQFQLSAADWIKNAAAFNYSIPVIIRGPIVGYTSSVECSHVHHDHTCVFLPMSTCQAQFLSSGTVVEAPRVKIHKNLDISMVPPQFAHMGLAWWWGIAQARLFRFQPEVENYINEKMIWMKSTHFGGGFPFKFPVAGIHVRHGDKSSDGFKDHSFSSEVLAIQKSPECVNKTSCLINLDVTKAIVTRSSMGAYRRTLDSNVDSGRLTVFVASDDESVLIASRSMGFLSLKAGVSQTSSTQGMAKTLVTNHGIAHNATLEIITDIYFLSQCSTLVGIASSQIFRSAVAMSNVAGRLKAAIVMDFDKIPKVQSMSDFYLVPFPEANMFIDSRQN